LQNKNIDTLTPTLGKILQYDGAKWNPSDKLPQMTTAQREAITNLYAGMTILNINTDCIEYYNGIKWLGLCGEEGEVGSSETGGLQIGQQMILESNYSFNDSISFLHSFHIGANIYVVSHVSGNIYKLKEYNTITKTWLQKSNCPHSLNTTYTYNSNYVFSSNGKGYFVEFSSASTNSTNIIVYEYSAISDTWTTSPLPQASRLCTKYFLQNKTQARGLR